jgi:hypothetical protein
MLPSADVAVDVAGLEAEVLACAATVHAANAALADALARFDAADGWQGAGIRSIGHWADINLGIAARPAAQLAKAAARLDELPALRAAFAEGAVSLDKVQLIAEVATAATDEKFATIARAGTVAQIRRICSTYRHVTTPDTPEAAASRAARRSVTVTPLDDGLVRIVALLEADEAAVVLAALDARVETAWRQSRPDHDDQPPPDLSERRATALAELATEGLCQGPHPVVRGERIEIRINVDADVLTGARHDGVCTIEGIGAASPNLVRRLACDATIRAAFEVAPGIFDLGRTHRLVNRRQRRALQKRDGGCRYPGCTQTRYIDAHHCLDWELGGRTDMNNLLLLCPHHHRLFHQAGYHIDPHGAGHFTFRRPDGRAITPPALAVTTPAPNARGTPTATDGGAPYDLTLTLDALLANTG